nr:uncharacterized protein LOC109418499 [Aedes albopictus]
METKKPNNQPSVIRTILRPVEIFFDVFFSHGALHGITYLGKSLLHLFEKILWMVLIVISLYFCVTLSLQSWERFLTKSTVVAIEKDHYYWNISLPSLTICPMDRIDRDLFDQFATRSLLNDEEKMEMFEFIESLANSTYINFEDIKGSENVDAFYHSPYDTINIARYLPYSMEAYEFEAYSIESVTSEDFREHTTVSQRGCRFFSESNLTHFNIYTKGICLQECRLKIAMDKCKCIPHFYPNNVRPPKTVCSYKQLKECFPPLKELFLEFRGGPEHDSINCYCEQNCVDSKVIIERTQVLVGTRKLLGSNGGLVLMKKYPLIRFSRQVLFTFTDLLVSIGGTAGLFLGFSVLGVVEIVYFFTLRLVWYCLGHR